MSRRRETIAEELRALAAFAPVLAAVAAEPAGDGVYLVGGAVRDLLLGRESFDLDITVEGDALALARRLAARLGGEAVTHGRFGTAVVRYGDGAHVDVVTARRERYAAPAALPEVEPGTIEDDLRRRDFTVNAIAASLGGADFGRIADPFGGRDDLAAGVIRILHDEAFIDDPTRIFRAIRYEDRLSFRMDAGTERRAQDAVGLIQELSGARVREELVSLLAEGGVEHTIERLAGLGVAAALHPGLAADEETAALVARLDTLRAELDPDAPAWRLRLGALARGIPPAALGPWLDRLALRRRDAVQIERAVALAPVLAAAADPVEIADLAGANAPDAPLLALALADVPGLREWFARLRNVRLEVSGGDLVELGLPESPRVGEVLDELRRRKLRGELDGREAELAAARELL
jgi:tRNA nucleotidyltransferase (CCA-adding enzyme)